ncbi:BrnA antitoxin family protein [Patescibacteria group bacterium]|nr:BrnA antitoxin family protein [Patescibacteria group bacterium]
MKKLPKFKSKEEEARFWDRHSPLDYPGEFTEVKEPFEFGPGLLNKANRRRLDVLAMKEKGKEKSVTKKFIDNLKKGRKKRTKGIPVSRLFKKIRAGRNEKS